MSDNNEYCIDIMQQNLAVIGLLKSAHLIMMENHLKTCFANAMDSNKEELKQKMIGEILTVTKHSNK
jgi:DNA-binding FrmR family transcriptional regulator